MPPGASLPRRMDARTTLKRLAIRTASVPVVVISVTAITWLLLRTLRPDIFPPDAGSVPAGLWHYLDRAFLHFDFGTSWQGSRRPVAEIIRKGLPADLSVLLGGLAVGVGLGVAGGAICGARPRAAASRALEVAALLCLCAPVFVVGLSLLLLFGQDIALVDVGVGIPTAYVAFADDPLGWLGALIVPWLVLGLPLAGLLLRMMRGSMIDVMDADFLRTASAKGLRPRTVLRRHAVPVAVAPTLNLAGAAMPIVLTNLVLVEKVWSVPGIFSTLNESYTEGNWPLVLGLVTVGAAITTLGGLAVDVALAWLDPRTRGGGTPASA